MKKFLLILSLIILGFTTSWALEPIKVAIMNTSTGAVNVQVNLTDYTGGTATPVYTGAMQSLTPNGSGVIIVNVANNTNSTDWSDILATDVNSYYILDIYVNGTLTAQYRLDQLILNQSQGGVLDVDGNLTPIESGAGSVGSDENRWGELYVTGNTVHIGPTSGEAGNTELALSYNGGTAKMTVDNTDALTATSTGVTIPGTLTTTGNTTLSNLAGAGTRNIAVNATGEVVVAESSVITNSTLTGNGTTATPLGLADNAVTSAKINNGTIVNDDVNGSAAIAYSKLNLNNSITNSDLTANSVSTSKVIDGTITSAKIFDNSIVNADVNASAAIAYSKLNLNNSIVTPDLTNNSVTSAKINNGTIVNDDVNASAAIAYSKLNLNNSIVAADITANAVTTAKINDGAVTTAKISSTGAASGNVLTYNGTNVVWAAPSGGGGGSAKVLVDNNNVTLGTIISFGNRASITVLTSAGYVVDITLELVNGFPFDTDQIYWTTGCATGDAYLNAGSTSTQKRNAKYLVYSGASGSLYTLANANANGVSTTVTFTSAEIENSGVCSANAGTKGGWLLTPITNVAAGLPATIAYPLTIQ